MTARRDEATAPFFDSLASGRLSVLHCPACSAWSPPGGFFSNPVVRCPACGSPDLKWSPTKGTGRVISWTTDPRFPSVIDGSPGQTAVLVEMDEGPWIFAALTTPADELREGTVVVVESVIPYSGGEPVPAVRAAV